LAISDQANPSIFYNTGRLKLAKTFILSKLAGFEATKTHLARLMATSSIIMANQKINQVNSLNIIALKPLNDNSIWAKRKVALSLTPPEPGQTSQNPNQTINERIG
jgi:hypothetical protein